MGFQDAVRSCFAQYFTFQGRATRSEFWYFVLFTFIGGLLTSMFGEVPNGLFGLIVFIPTISVSVRRLHDTGRSGWWWWLCLIPVVGWIILLVFYTTCSQPGENDYGYDPLEQAISADAPPRDPAAKPHWSDRIDESEFTRTNIPDVPRD